MSNAHLAGSTAAPAADGGGGGGGAWFRKLASAL